MHFPIWESLGIHAIIRQSNAVQQSFQDVHFARGDALDKTCSVSTNTLHLPPAFDLGTCS